MARIDLTIDNELEAAFRNVVYDTYGFKRGNMKAATEEAIRLWIKNKTK